MAFGESLLPDIKKGYGQYQPYSVRLEQREEKYTYVNRRAQMYGELSRLLDPSNEQVLGANFAIPFNERLRKQLSVMPKLYDQEGRMFLEKLRDALDSGDAGQAEVQQCHVRPFQRNAR